jgi:GDP-L-fucose synthase
MPTEAGFTLGGKRVWVAGHKGMVGSAIVRRLARENCEVLVVDRNNVNLKDQAATRAWVGDMRPDAIFLAAARVGGILANDSLPADFLYDNLMIEANVIEAAFRAKTAKLLFLGSSCIYPKFAPQPIPEEALLTAPLEPTNEWYAIAKIAGIKLCQAYRRQHHSDFISAMPTNLYGPGDNFDLDSSHVIPALMRKAFEAKARRDKEIVIWGTCVHLMKAYSGESHVNVGSGKDLTILELTKLVCDVVGFEGTIAHDLSKPDGTPRKLMSADKIRALGWTPTISLRGGLADSFRWYLENIAPGEAGSRSAQSAKRLEPH